MPRKSSQLVAYQDQVTLWQTRLGLERWKIDVKIAEEPMEAYAECSPSAQYEFATITFSPNIESSVVEATVVHELLHILTKDIDSVIEDARAQLHPQASFQVEKRYDHALESFVDRLAQRIVEIAGDANGTA